MRWVSDERWVFSVTSSLFLGLVHSSIMFGYRHFFLCAAHFQPLTHDFELAFSISWVDLCFSAAAICWDLESTPGERKWLRKGSRRSLFVTILRGRCIQNMVTVLLRCCREPIKCWFVKSNGHEKGRFMSVSVNLARYWNVGIVASRAQLKKSSFTVVAKM